MSKDVRMLLLTIVVTLAAGLYFAVYRGTPIQKLSDTIPLEEKVAMEETKNLVIEDLVVGTGREAVAGNTITVNYSGTLLNGTKFDNSYDRGVPFTFILGAGEVIAGWDQGFSGMKVGGKRKLTIPSHLGYGERGAGSDIPPNSTLIFEVELLEVN